MSLQTVKAQVKYGLINKKAPSASGKFECSSLKKIIPKLIDCFIIAPQRLSKVASVFASAEEDSYLEDDDEQASNTGPLRGQSEIAKASKAILSSGKLSTGNSSLRDTDVDIDTSIYDYDGQYDDFKKESESKRFSSQLSSSSSSSDAKVS